MKKNEFIDKSVSLESGIATCWPGPGIEVGLNPIARNAKPASSVIFFIIYLKICML